MEDAARPVYLQYGLQDIGSKTAPRYRKATEPWISKNGGGLELFAYPFGW